MKIQYIPCWICNDSGHTSNACACKHPKFIPYSDYATLAFENEALNEMVRELEKSDVLLRRLYDCVCTDDFGDLCLTYAAEDVVKEIERVIGGE